MASKQTVRHKKHPESEVGQGFGARDVLVDKPDTGSEPQYENAERVLHLLYLLSGGDCTQEDILGV